MGSGLRKSDDPIGSAVNLLSAMANEKRLRVLLHLVKAEVKVGELAELVGLSQSAVSQHLSSLRKQGLVKRRREMQAIFYRCDHIDVLEMLNLLDDAFGLEQ